MADGPLGAWLRRAAAALQADARLSVQELAERINLSTSPTWRRLKSLEERGYIKDYIARFQVAAEAWYVSNPRLSVPQAKRLEKIDKALNEFLDKIS